MYKDVKFDRVECKHFLLSRTWCLLVRMPSNMRALRTFVGAVWRHKGARVRKIINERAGLFPHEPRCNASALPPLAGPNRPGKGVGHMQAGTLDMQSSTLSHNNTFASCVYIQRAPKERYCNGHLMCCMAGRVTLYKVGESDLENGGTWVGD